MHQPPMGVTMLKCCIPPRKEKPTAVFGGEGRLFLQHAGRFLRAKNGNSGRLVWFCLNAQDTGDERSSFERSSQILRPSD